MDSPLLMVHDMGARPEGTLSRAGLWVLGLMSIVGFLPVLASYSATVGVQSSAGAAPRHEVAARPEVHGLAYERLTAQPAIAVFEPAAAPPPAPAPATPEPAAEPAAAPPEPEPTPAPEPAPVVEAAAPEFVAAVPPEAPPSQLASVGSGLADVVVPVTEALPLPVVSEVVPPLLGGLLGRG